MADNQYRTIDGTNNNHGYNATGTDFTRIGDAHFADDISVPLETVNPRTVSNQLLVKETPQFPMPKGFPA